MKMICHQAIILRSISTISQNIRRFSNLNKEYTDEITEVQQISTIQMQGILTQHSIQD